MKTTKKHFEIFKKECQMWEKRFELSGWDIRYWHEQRSKGLSSTTRDLIGRGIDIYLSFGWNIPITVKEIKDCAKHEMIHTLLARVSENGKARWLTDTDYYEAEEELVYKLEKIIK